MAQALRFTAPRALVSMITATAVALGAVGACSGDAPPAADHTDASVAAPALGDVDARAIVARVAGVVKDDPRVLRWLEPKAQGFEREAAGATSPGWRSALTERAYHVGAILPELASEPLQAGIGKSELYRLRLVHKNANVVPLTLVDGLGVYADAYPSTDIVYSAAPERVEWFYYQRDERAPSEVAFEVVLPKNIPLGEAKADGTVSFLGDDGEPLLRMPESVVIDADGRRRAVQASYDGQTLRLSWDRAGLRFPIVVDPAVETAVWDAKSLPPEPAEEMPMASNSSDVWMLAGYSGFTSGSDMWHYDGNGWSLRSKVGPGARRGARMTNAGGPILLFGGLGKNDLWSWNGTAWTELCTSAACQATRPSARYRHWQAWHSATSTLVVYGGNDGAVKGDTYTWNGTAWTAGCTSCPPGAREGAAFASDTLTGKEYLFGGINGATYLGTTYSWDGTTWVLVTSTGPSARYGAQMVEWFPSWTNTFTLFGGRTSTGPSNETWTFSGSAWTQNVVAAPSARYYHGAAASVGSQGAGMVVFGGNDGTNRKADTWQWNGTSWTQTDTSLGQRTGSAMFYDQSTSPGRILLFGGYNGTSYLGDTWQWTGSDWQQLSPAASPPARANASITYDTARKRAVLFGGQNGSSSYRGDTWEWTGTTWLQVCASCTVTARAQAAMAFDSTRNITVLYGGYNGADFGDTWEYNGAAWTQRCTAAPCTTTKPTARSGASAVFHTGSLTYTGLVNRVVLFGGLTSPLTFNNDTWEWDGTTWALEPAAPGSLEGRRGAAMFYDPRREQTTLFSGGALASYPDQFQRTSGVWNEITGTLPPGRINAAHAYDSFRNRWVVFGGGDFFNTRGDTWEYHTRGGSCPAGAQCASGYCVDGVCCESLVCGTCQACDVAGSEGTCANAVAQTSDVDTCSSPNQCNGSGSCLPPKGASCTAGSQCASGSCVDGVCCDTACTGGCQACSLAAGASADGTCTTLASGAGGDCVGYVCAGATSCPSTCATDSHCAATYFCAYDNTCQPRRGTGIACNTAAAPAGDCKVASCRECTSGNCVDGVCCSTTCNTACKTCSATPGTCTNVTNAQDPDTCTGTNLCSASGTCLKVNGQSCTAAAQCASGTCTGGFCQPAACSDDTQCTSTYCNPATSTCAVKQAGGAACTGAVQCTSGFCVDGFCCNNACGGLCQACSAGKTGGANGTCANVATGSDPDNECAQDTTASCDQDGTCAGGACRNYASGTSCAASSCLSGTATTSSCDGSGACVPSSASCGNFACNGTVCYAACTADTHCATGYYCAAGGTCQAKKANGGACTSTNQCSSGNCVDGVCCDAPCNGTCQACTAALKTSGADGVCGNSKVDTDPHNNCAADATTCGLTGACTGSGACKYAASGTVCGTTSCTNGIQTGQQCNGTGTCTSGSSTNCAAGYACLNANACATSCTGDAQCSAQYWCRGDGTCQPDQANGATCSAAAQCTSGNCVDGVCCDSPCSGTCQACSAAKTGQTEGSCKPVTANSDPDNDCAATASNTCGGNGLCDGVGACKFWPSGTVCGSTACAGGVQTGSQCNGTGACVTGSSAPCQAAYVCLDAQVCATSCTDDTQCAGGYWCNNGSCVTAQATGATCNRTRQCGTGNCVDGFCCDSPCVGKCQACSNPKTGVTSGTCSPVKVDTDPDAECAQSAQSTCGDNGSCDGAGGCKKWPLNTSCDVSSCANALQTGKVCDGSGTCIAGQSVPCATGYVCASGSVCATTCSADAQCVASYWCRTSDSSCVADQANGATCSSASQCTSGNCVDGVCCDSPCSGSCQACSAAKKGQGASGTCGAVVSGSDPDSECAQDAAATCDRTGSCDGAGACALYASGTSCGASTCTTGSPFDQQAGSACDGFGECRTSQVTSCGLFHCKDPSTCDADCNSDAECVAAAYCDIPSHTCRADQAPGAACSSAGQCASNYCVDGVCCESACTGACVTCSAAKKAAGGVSGTCEAVAAGSDPDSDCSDDGPAGCGKNGQCNAFGACDFYASGTPCGSTTCVADAVTGGTQTGSTCNGSGVCLASVSTNCAPYVCQGTVCGGACVSDADCIAPYFCAATGTCVTDLDVGGACQAASQCKSGNCVDGVCCDSPCSGTCQACSAAKTGGPNGTCASVAALTDPDNECDQESQAGCGKSGVCSGSGSCAKYAQGTACGATTCTSGSQQGSACDGFGACQPGQQSSCGLYSCQGSACGTACAVVTDCVASAYCDTTTSTCVPDKSNGATCSADGECVSGHCTDGVCCESACSGACQACSSAKKGQGGDGTCGAVVAGSDPDSECAATSPDQCGTDGVCDGAGACRKHLPGTACGATDCSTDGRNLTGSQCDGFGACQASVTTDCLPYNCAGSTSCKTSCTTVADCATGYFCASDFTCKTRSANGAACQGTDECQSGFCVDGVCCNSACDGSCQACAATDKESATDDGLCGPARAGTDPHNSCAGKPVADCDEDGTCDGQGSCHVYAAGTACGATSCNGNVQEGFACDGSGTCNANATTDCGLFTCNGGRCTVECQSDGDCSAAGYCDLTSQRCITRAQNGEACSLGNTCVSGVCVDGVCCNAACDGQCEACDLPTALGTCSPVIGAPHGQRPACAAAPGTAPDELCQARACNGTTDRDSCVGYVGQEVACRDQSCVDGRQSFTATCTGTGTCGAASDGAATIKNCAPYVCADDKSCLDNCTADDDCKDGNRCDTATSTCVSSTTCDGTSTLTTSTGETVDCAPFKCTLDGACVERCSSSDQCVSGHVCNSDGLCVRITREDPAQDSGCGCRAAGQGADGRAPWALLASAALAWARRRRAGRGAPL